MSIPVTNNAPYSARCPALDRVRAYGQHSLAYSGLQRDMRVFEYDAGGAVFHQSHFGHTLVLGDPLCGPSGLESTLDAFLNTYSRPVFAQVSHEVAVQLAERGFRVTPVGCDTEIDVQGFTRRGHAKRDVRRAWNRGNHAGLTVTEARNSPALRFEMRQLSQRWLQSCRVNRRELRFLVRPLEAFPEPGVRVFVANHGARLMGFIVFDPRYRAGCNVGYAASILRTEPDAPAATLDFILLNALEQFRQEGVKRLSLGVMPFHNLEESVIDPVMTAKPLYSLLRFIARTDCAPFLNVHGLNFHKSRYRPKTKPVYLAARSATGLLPMALLTRACGLIP